MSIEPKLWEKAEAAMDAARASREDVAEYMRTTRRPAPYSKLREMGKKQEDALDAIAAMVMFWREQAMIWSAAHGELAGAAKKMWESLK